MYCVLVCKSVAKCSHSKLIPVIIEISLINENAYTKILATKFWNCLVFAYKMLDGNLLMNWNRINKYVGKDSYVGNPFTKITYSVHIHHMLVLTYVYIHNQEFNQCFIIEEYPTLTIACTNAVHKVSTVNHWVLSFCINIC